MNTWKFSNFNFKVHTENLKAPKSLLRGVCGGDSQDRFLAVLLAHADSTHHGVLDTECDLGSFLTVPPAAAAHKP